MIIRQTARVTGTGVAFTIDTSGHNKVVTGWSVHVSGVGANPTSHTTVVQISLDGTNWFTVSTHNTTTPGTVVHQVAGGVCTLQVRVNVTALVLGSATGLDIQLNCHTN